ncbi:MAG: hypothetical protein OES69_02395 [Myxococcales bacterium]|nr:hypothetical protein [Myxococcales bacterium]
MTSADDGNGGYVKTWRSILDNPVLKNPTAWFLFTRFFIMASHKTERVNWRGSDVILERGQLVISLREWSEKYGLTRKAIRYQMGRLEKHDMVRSESVWGPGQGPYGSIITICNYASFQGSSGNRGPGHFPLGAHVGPTEQESIPNPSCDSVTPRESVFNDRQIETYSRNSESPPPHARADARVRAGSSGDDLFDGGERQIKPRPDLAFNGSVIRMSPQRFDEFVELYPEITNHRAELHSLDLWIATLDKDKRQNWESVLASAMAKKINNPAFRNGTGRAQEEDETPAWLVPGYGGIKD